MSESGASEPVCFTENKSPVAESGSIPGAALGHVWKSGQRFRRLARTSSGGRDAGKGIFGG